MLGSLEQCYIVIRQDRVLGEGSRIKDLDKKSTQGL